VLLLPLVVDPSPTADAVTRWCATLLLLLLRVKTMLRPLLLLLLPLLLLPLVVKQCVQRVGWLTAAVQGCVQPLLR
jgi:hypothetical protein